MLALQVEPPSKDTLNQGLNPVLNPSIQYYKRQFHVLQCVATLPEPLQDKQPQYCRNTIVTLIVVMHSSPQTCHSVSLAIYKSNRCNLMIRVSILT